MPDERARRAAPTSAPGHAGRPTLPTIPSSAHGQRCSRPGCEREESLGEYASRRPGVTALATVGPSVFGVFDLLAIFSLIGGWIGAMFPKR
jgi:hypothetical protein